MTTYFLLIVVLILLLLMLNYSKGDIFVPVNIVLLAFAFSLVFVIAEMSKWDGNISLKTFGVILNGLLSYIFGTLFSIRYAVKIKRLPRVRVFRYEKAETPEEMIPYILTGITFFVIVFDLFILAKYYSDVRNSASTVGTFSSLGNMIGLYRDAGVSGNLEVGISKISAYGYTAMTALAYLYLYNIMVKVVMKSAKIGFLVFNAIPIVLFGICSILTGGRNPLIQLMVAAIMMYYLLYMKYRGVNHRFNRKFAVRLCVIVVIALFAFSNMRSLVGRTNTYSTFDYIAMYIGAPIKLFDMFLENPPTSSHIFWGQETFVNLWTWLGSIIGDNRMTSLIMNKEFRTYNDIQLGNVYTAFREYYRDFGWGGGTRTPIHPFNTLHYVLP